MSNLPCGVTNADIDALWMTDEEEERRDRIVAWLVSDRKWWRRYLCALHLERRREMMYARLDEGYPYDATDQEVRDEAEALRSDSRSYATITAAWKVQRARRERGQS